MYRIFQDDYPAFTKVREFLEMEEGWHFGEGVTPTRETAKIALNIAEKASLSLLSTDVFPGISGEIQLSVYHKNHYLEFIVEPNGAITYARESDDQEIEYEEGIRIENAIEKLNNLVEEIWPNTSEHYTPDILTKSEKDSSVWHSKIHQAVESQFSIVSAQKIQVMKSANTSEFSIPQFLATLQSSGSFAKKTFPEDVHSISAGVAQVISATAI